MEDTDFISLLEKNTVENLSTENEIIDALNTLRRTGQRDGFNWSEKEIRDTRQSTLIAGHRTNTGCSTCAWLLISSVVWSKSGESDLRETAAVIRNQEFKRLNHNNTAAGRQRRRPQKNIVLNNLASSTSRWINAAKWDEPALLTCSRIKNAVEHGYHLKTTMTPTWKRLQPAAPLVTLILFTFLVSASLLQYRIM